MGSRLVIGLAVLLVAALVAPTADAATQLRQVRVPISTSATTPPTGTLTLDLVFKNKRSSKQKFTPRQLTRIDFAQVPLQCFNSAGTGTSQLPLTTTLQTTIKLTKAPQPSGRKPKPHRFAFRFAYAFTAFNGTLRGTIDRANHGPRRLRSQGTLSIVDLDADSDHMNCNSNGLKQWGGLPVTLVR
ncbi:MAG TPA: hypothetical protein VIZ61_12750 [Solirubrobacterales bacterium]